MPKKQDPERFKTFDVMLPQGARARHAKAVKGMELADDLVPLDALDGTSAEIREAIKHLNEAATNLAEMMAYRKMLGVRLMIRSTELIERLRRERPDTLGEIAKIRQAQRERGWKLIALDIEAFERAEGEAQREAEAQR